MKAARIILSACALFIAIGGTVAGVISEKAGLVLAAVNTFTTVSPGIETCSVSTDCATTGARACLTQAYSNATCTIQVAGRRP